MGRVAGFKSRKERWEHPRWEVEPTEDFVFQIPEGTLGTGGGVDLHG